MNKLNNYLIIIKLFLTLLINTIYNYFKTFDIKYVFISNINLICKINVLYIKIFQIIGTNSNYFNKNLTNYLIKYLDNVPFDKSEEIINDYLYVFDNIGKNNKDLNIDLNSIKYLNSGTISIVYKAKMNNKDVVIKTIRKDIDKKLNNAIEIFEIIIYFIYNLPYLKYFYFNDIFEENKQSLINQLDFHNEIKNIKIFQNDNKYYDKVLIPNVYDIFTTHNKNILVMDYIDGLTINNIEKNDIKDFIDIFLQFSFKSILFSKNYHADLHGGNLFFLKKNIENNNNNNKIGIIDFGIIGNLTKIEQNNYYEFINNFFIDKNSYTTTKLIINHITTNINNNKIISFNSEDLYNDVFKVIDFYLKKSNIDHNFIYFINKKLRKYNLKIKPYFTKLELSCIIGDSVIKYFYPESQILELISENVKIIFNNI